MIAIERRKNRLNNYSRSTWHHLEKQKKAGYNPAFLISILLGTSHRNYKILN